jgi:hypothetical protein
MEQNAEPMEPLCTVRLLLDHLPVRSLRLPQSAGVVVFQPDLKKVLFRHR